MTWLCGVATNMYSPLTMAGASWPQLTPVAANHTGRSPFTLARAICSPGGCAQPPQPLGVGRRDLRQRGVAPARVVALGQQPVFGLGVGQAGRRDGLVVGRRAGGHGTGREQGAQDGESLVGSHGVCLRLMDGGCEPAVCGRGVQMGGPIGPSKRPAIVSTPSFNASGSMARRRVAGPLITVPRSHASNTEP